MANKVQFGLKNVYYATITYGSTGITYGTPVAWPGAVSIGFSAEGDANKFFADNAPYFTGVANNGYSGDFECAKIPDSFRKDIMLESYDTTKKIYTENANVQPKEFALLFEFDGDDSATRYVFYNCKMTRTGVEGETTTDSVEVKTVTANITASPRADGVVKASCDDATSTAYTGWYTSVQEA